MDYYRELLDRCASLGRTETIGHTRLGYGIPLVYVGKEPADTLIVASVHAREHITTDLTFALMERTDRSFDYVPVLNIDGVLLCKNGADWIENPRLKRFLTEVNGGSTDFSLWKANAYAVDINVNFDAAWGTGRYNVRYPSPANFIGRSAGSEPETKAAASLAGSGRYSQAVAYHSKGEVVYWGFGSNYSHYEEAKLFSDSLGYRLLTSEGSAGGLKDYYDTVSAGLGLTVEAGEDGFPHPYPVSELSRLTERHTDSLEILYDNGKKIARKLHGGGV